MALLSVANTTAAPGDTILMIVLLLGLTGVSASGVQLSVGLLDCTAGGAVLGASTIQCATSNVVPDFADGADESMRYTIVAAVDPGIVTPTTLPASFSVTGGGATDASTVDVHLRSSPRVRRGHLALLWERERLALFARRACFALCALGFFTHFVFPRTFLRT